MSGWRRIPLGDLAESVDYGVTASASQRPIGPKFLRITDIQDGAVNWDSVPWCDCDERSASDSRLRPGDIVFARTGATTGKSFLIRGCPANAGFASYLIRVRLNDAAEPGFVSHFFQTHDYWAQITKSARGLAQPGVNATTLKALRVPLPPLPEQRRIAEILDKADALRAKRRAALAQLDTLTQSIFLDMFGDPATNPKGWLREPLTSACHCYSGGTPAKENPENWTGSLPWFSPKDLKQHDLFDSEDHINESIPSTTSLRLLPADTVAIVVRGMILAHTFPVSVLRVPATVNQDLKALLPRKPIDAQFLAHCLRVQSSRALGQVSESAHGTKRLDADGLDKLQVLHAPTRLQRRFAELVERSRQALAELGTSRAGLDALFASLQHRAFRGELPQTASGGLTA